MDVKWFVKYMTQAKGQFLRENGKDVEDVKLLEDSSEEVVFAIRGIGEIPYRLIKIKKQAGENCDRCNRL
ncbi:MAG: hypothetical protein ACRCXX_13820 [Cetobacterium sp.]|uniref:hypothetical protein n=1 Tax=Cetobacterium sp. TaxID=2071632 RepID=UPI003F3431B6